ncbi:tail fiber domain-containing protein [Aeromonas veronii]|uniref:tail fiber domain-containing protein n=1 Tax=Aeromonas veronii TaxID=654 RepID=UPI0032EF8EA8
MGYKVIVNEYSNLQGLNSTKVLVSEYASIGSKTTKVIVVEDTNIGSTAYNEAKAAAVEAKAAAAEAKAEVGKAVLKLGPQTMEGPLTSTGKITTGSSVELIDSAGYGMRQVFSGSTGYLQAGKTDRTATDQSLMLSGWFGTPLSLLRLNMAQGENPKVVWGSSRYDILHRGNMPTLGELNGVNLNDNSYWHNRGAVSDLNTATLPGHYQGGAVLTNGPVGTDGYKPGYGHMFVSSTDGRTGSGYWITQTYYSHSNPSRTFTRVNVNGSWASWIEIYTTSYKPTASDVGTLTTAEINTELGKKLNLSGGALSGNIVISNQSTTGILAIDSNGFDSQVRLLNKGSMRWIISRDATAENATNGGSDFNIFYYNNDGSFRGSALKITRQDGVTIFNKNPVLSVAQANIPEALTRKDYVDSEIIKVGTGSKVQVIDLPAGSPTTGYIPVLIRQYSYTNPEIYISTTGNSGSYPMNNCSFDGIVRASGWGDHTSYASGQFTAYDMAERAIHSIHGPSESVNTYAFYVEVRAFPITLKVPVGVNIECTGKDIQAGTSIYKVNGQESGNTKTITLANFTKGSGFYNGSAKVYNTSFKPTMGELGDNNGDLLIERDNTEPKNGVRRDGRTIYLYDSSANHGLYSTLGETGARGNTQMIYRVVATGAINVGSNIAPLTLHSSGKLLHNTAEVYTSANKPTATDVGTLSTSQINAALVLKSDLTYVDTELAKKFDKDSANLTLSSRLTSNDVLTTGGWLRTTGATGWYSETYGGGWMMSDTDWIRSYGGKKVHIAAAVADSFYTTGGIRADMDIRANNFQVVSDRRLKSDVVVLENALDKVLRLTGYVYTKNEQREAGVMAQDVQQVLPEAVREDSDGYLSVSHNQLTALLIEAIKELTARVKKLEGGTE